MADFVNGVVGERLGDVQLEAAVVLQKLFAEKVETTGGDDVPGKLPRVSHRLCPTFGTQEIYENMVSPRNRLTKEFSRSQKVRDVTAPQRLQNNLPSPSKKQCGVESFWNVWRLIRTGCRVYKLTCQFSKNIDMAIGSSGRPRRMKLKLKMRAAMLGILNQEPSIRKRPASEVQKTPRRSSLHACFCNF